MELTAFEKLVRQNRSYRGFDESRKVDREELLRMVDCARLSASSVNLQPLKYYLAWEPEAVGRIQPLTGWARNLPEMTLPHKGMYPTAFIVICQDKSISDSLARFQKDVGIAAQTILLAAVEMEAGRVKDALELPEDLAPMLIVAIGKPAEEVVIREIEPGEPTPYYRDEQDVHYVPKRKLADIVIH